MIGNSLIDVLVMPTEKSELLALRKAHCIAMRENTTPRREQNYWGSRVQRLDRFEERLRLHDHTSATAVWCVVDRAVLVVGEVAQVDEIVSDTSSRGSTGRDTQPKRALEEIRENRDDVDLERHGSVFGQRGIVQKSKLVVDDDRARVAVYPGDDFRPVRDEHAAAGRAEVQHDPLRQLVIGGYRADSFAFCTFRFHPDEVVEINLVFCQGRELAEWSEQVAPPPKLGTVAVAQLLELHDH